MISAYLVDTVTIKYLVSLDPFQKPTWSSVVVKARVEWSNKLVRNTRGEQVVAAARIYLAGDIATPPTTADRIIFDGVEHVIMRVDKKAAFSTSHYEAWIQ
jgi:hypothetical protein